MKLLQACLSFLAADDAYRKAREDFIAAKGFRGAPLIREHLSRSMDNHIGPEWHLAMLNLREAVSESIEGVDNVSI